MHAAVILPILLLAACSVSKDPNNNAMTLSYDNAAVENGTRAVTSEIVRIHTISLRRFGPCTTLPSNSPSPRTSSRSASPLSASDS